MSDDYGDLSLFGLFAQETEAQAALLGDGLLLLERTPDDAATLESCMRAAHSLKGAARIVGVSPGVAIAHVMEECFVQAQRHEITLEPGDIDLLLRGVDLLRDVALAGEGAAAPATMADVIAALERVCAGEHADTLARQSARDGMDLSMPGTGSGTMPDSAGVTAGGPVRLDEDRRDPHFDARFDELAPPFPAFDFPQEEAGEPPSADEDDAAGTVAAEHGRSADAAGDAEDDAAQGAGVAGAAPRDATDSVMAPPADASNGFEEKGSQDVDPEPTASSAVSASMPLSDRHAEDVSPDHAHDRAQPQPLPVRDEAAAATATSATAPVSFVPAAPALAPATSAPAPIAVTVPPAAPNGATPPSPPPGNAGNVAPTGGERTLRVAARNLDRLLALSGHAVVEARTFRPLITSMVSLTHRQRETVLAMQLLRNRLIDARVDEIAMASFEDIARLVENLVDDMAAQAGAIEDVEQRHHVLSNQLYEAALSSRMRPFADITGGYARMVREVSRGLGKQVKFSIAGETVPVDRDILALLDAPLGHLLRNAVDHGIEMPDTRRAAGKPDEGTIRIEARHVAGTLVIDVADDGGGVDIEAVRSRVVKRGLVNAVVAPRLSEAELLEFLMLPGFSMREKVSDVSGRGVGLDVVQTMVRQVRGSMRISQTRGEGTRFQLQLPLTLSVMRCLVADIGAEPYGFPLAHIVRALRVPADAVETVEGRPHFTLDGKAVALVMASQVLRAAPPPAGDGNLQVVVLGSEDERYGLVVDRFREERMLVVQPIDARLGKVTDIAAGSLMEDGTPVLIVDADDMLRSMARLASAARVDVVTRASVDAARTPRKRVLVVDDSLTVRELQRKLLTNGGYDVSVAVDGMEGWNALMSNRFDLVVTDVDMPRLDGIELVTMIRRDPEFRTLPVMIVSYKDRAADRQRGLDAGADHYLAKSSFHDAALLDAVRDLIGESAG